MKIKIIQYLKERPEKEKKEERMVKEIERDLMEIIIKRNMISKDRNVLKDQVENEKIKVIEEVTAKIDITEEIDIEEREIDQDQKKKIKIIRKEREIVEIEARIEKVRIIDL